MDSYDPPTKCWCVVTWQIKSVTYPLWQDLWLWNLANWWLMVRQRHPPSHMSFWPPDYKRSRDKLKLKISSSRRFMATKRYRVLTYGEAKPIMKLHESNHVIARGHMLSRKLNISSSTRPISPHLAGWWGMTLWLCSLVRSHENFKTKN